MSVNPFLSMERQNFPEFSPMFKKKTPSSTEKNTSFRWSIDQIARLKPADIDIDPATFAKTNGHSPAADSEAEKASENFFSQKTILPSPWTGPAVLSKAGGGPLPNKRVTFSPLPPATAFIREESLVESEVRDNQTTDAGTQTVMTFPVNFDLFALLGPGFNYLEEKLSCDLGNSSLRRKLFGQPERQGSSSLSSSLSSEIDEIQTEPTSPKIEPFTPLRNHLKTPMSKKTMSRYPSNSSTPSNALFSPAIASSNPAHSSMVFGVQGSGKFLDISPIGQSEVVDTAGPGEVGCLPSKETKEAVGEESLLPTVAVMSSDGGKKEQNRQNLRFPSTPGKDAHLQSLPSLSPICGLGMSPVPVRESNRHHGISSTPAVDEKVQVHLTSGKAACTSTPNTAALKRQLVASPFASPVLKQPCKKRLDVVEEDSSPEGQALVRRSPSCDIISDESDSESSMPQPLSLADLQTETYELTSITPTTCTSYFAQCGLDDPNDNDLTMANGQHPLHSTATGHMTTGSAHWNPPIHSTMVDSQCQVQMSTQAAHIVGSAVPQVSLPLVGSLSRIHPHLTSSTSSISNGTSRSAIADSGVAALSDFNFSMTTALHGSVKARQGAESGIAVSSSCEPALKTAGHNEEEDLQKDVVTDVRRGGGNGKDSDRLGETATSVTKCPLRIEGRDGVEGKKTFPQGDERDRNPAYLQKEVCSHHSEVDSGLVFSPEQNFERLEEAGHNFLTCERLHPPSPLTTAASRFSSWEQQRLAHLHTRHDKTPSRHSNSNMASVQSSVGSTAHVPLSPGNVHHIGGAPNLLNNGVVGGACNHCPTFTSRLTSKYTGLSTGIVLPSRLKLSSTSGGVATGLKSPTYTSTNPSGAPLCNHGNFETHAALSMDVFRQVGGASRTTPTSRFSNKGSGKTSLSGMTDDIIRKKESLKARLKFSNPVDSTINGGSAGSLLQSPVSTRPSLGRQRVPLCESSLNRPRSPLTRWHNKGLSPFSPSQLSPIHHHNHQSHPFVVKSPWQPPISLSPVDGCHSQRSKFKLSVT